MEELSKNGEETTNYWSEVAHLVDEYNQLSEQIKTLVSENNEVEEINAPLYNQTYQQLQEKLSKFTTPKKKRTRQQMILKTRFLMQRKRMKTWKT